MVLLPYKNFLFSLYLHYFSPIISVGLPELCNLLSPMILCSQPYFKYESPVFSHFSVVSRVYEKLFEIGLRLVKGRRLFRVIVVPFDDYDGGGGLFLLHF